MNEQAIVESLFRGVGWKDGTHGFMECPGIHLHSGKNSPKDCKIFLDEPPSITCFHQSCSSLVVEANYKMRRALWDNKPGEKREMTSEDKARIKKDMEEKREVQKLVEWTERNKKRIFDKYAWPIADVFHQSPVTTDACENDHKALLSLFDVDDVIWNGDVKDSGSPENAKNFKIRKEWMAEGLLGNFTCPSAFKPGSFSRSNENVIRRPFLVVESDVLTGDETCAVFSWMKLFCELRAIVYTGGKSYHGWFDYPDADILKKLYTILPALGCDKAMFKASQPVRMPGIMREDKNKMQCLYYFNPKL